MAINEVIMGQIQEVPANEVLEKEIKTAEDDAHLKKTIEDWYEKTRTQGMKLGAQMICAAGTEILRKHLSKHNKPSLRDYERAVAELTKIFAVPLKQTVVTEQNNGESNGEESSI